MKIAKLTACGALLALTLPLIAQTIPSLPADPWSVEVGLNYMTGKFGFSEDTDLWMQTTTVHFEQNPIHLQLTVPFISIRGPASVIGEVGRPTTKRESGLGDVTIGATYKFTDGAGGASDLDFTTRVKLPTADDDKGLGTGETDADFEFNYHHNLGAFTPFATVGYRFLGSSALYPLKDGFYTTAGVATPLSDTTVGGVAISWRERITEGADNATEAMAFLSTKLDEHWKLQGFALSGFTDASPDFGVGGLVGFRF